MVFCRTQGCDRENKVQEARGYQRGQRPGQTNQETPHTCLILHTHLPHVTHTPASFYTHTCPVLHTLSPCYIHLPHVTPTPAPCYTHTCSMLHTHLPHVTPTPAPCYTHTCFMLHTHPPQGILHPDTLFVFDESFIATGHLRAALQISSRDQMTQYLHPC